MNPRTLRVLRTIQSGRPPRNISAGRDYDPAAITVGHRVRGRIVVMHQLDEVCDFCESTNNEMEQGKCRLKLAHFDN
jgi:hypothetical protein